ncbi:MAG: hypothetical protein IJ481_03320 [Alphaproteobacteria bacterium]|nr:hypothetical protein [Alphaproteobacteria bacterium]
MSLYASTIAVPTEVNNPITIGSSTKDTKVATDLTNTDYNYWSTTENKTYVFNTSSSNTCWRANNTVTIDNGYTLKLITNHTNGYYYVLYCYNTFTNNGNVIIDKYGVLDLNIKTSNNNGTIDINNGLLTLFGIATLNNTGTITFKVSSYIDIHKSSILNNTRTITLTGSSHIYIHNSSILNNTATITLKDSSYIIIHNSSILNNTGTITLTGSGYIKIYDSTLTNTGTIDMYNITDLSKWYNTGTFTLKGGSTFILPKSILEDSKKIGSTYTFNPITLNGTKDNPVIFKCYTHEPYIDNNSIRVRPISDALTYTSLDDIINKTGFTFTGNTSNVSFIPIKYTLSDILTIDGGKYNDNIYTLDISQLDIIPTIDSHINIDTKLIIPEGYTLTVNGDYVRGNIGLNGGKIVFK